MAHGRSRIGYVALTLCLAVPVVAHAQGYTFLALDLPAASGAPGRTIALVGLANDGTMAGDDQSAGGLGSRITPTLTVTPVTCAPGTFTRSPFASRAGPEVVGLNNALTVVGNDEGATALYGFVQTVDGVCQFFLVPGSLGTLYTGIADDGRIVGQYWNDPGLEPGLRRFHGLVHEPTGPVTALTTGDGTDVLWPTGINGAGTIIGYAFLDVQPDNAYTYQAFYVQGGVVTWLDGPGGEDVWPTSINNAGQITAVLQPQGGIGGPAWLYDTVTRTWMQLPWPTPATTAVLFHGLNDHGALVGLYTEVFPDPPPFGQSVTHQVLATPTAVVADTEDPPVRHPRVKHPRRRLARLRDWLQDNRGPQDKYPRLRQPWTPALDTDGTVVLTDGVRVLGRKRGR